MQLYICHRHKIQVKENMTRFRCSYSNWGFWQWHQQMCRQSMASPLCMCSGFPVKISEQMIVTPWNDVTVISHVILGGKYKRRAHMNLRGCHLGFWYWRVGSIDKSQTLYSSYLGASCGAEHNQEELCVLFIHMHIPRPIGGTFQSVWLQLFDS